LPSSCAAPRTTKTIGATMTEYSKHVAAGEIERLFEEAARRKAEEPHPNTKPMTEAAEAAIRKAQGMGMSIRGAWQVAREVGATDASEGTFAKWWRQIEEEG
jgi:hypothetical protein